MRVPFLLLSEAAPFTTAPTRASDLSDESPMFSGGKRWWLAAGVAVLLAAGAYLGGSYLLTRYHTQAAREALDRREFEAALDHLEWCRGGPFVGPEARLLGARAARRMGAFTAALLRLEEFKERYGPTPACELEERLLAVQGGDLAEGRALLDAWADRPDAEQTPLVLEAFVVAALPRLAPDPAAPGEQESDPEDEARAMDAAERWLRLRPGREDRAQGLLWRGRLFNLRGDADRAEADFRGALALIPNHVEARVLLAEAVARRSPEEAVARLRELHEADPKDARVRSDLAGAVRRLGRFDEARRLLDGVLAENPDDVSALVERGLLDLDERRPADAEPRLRRAFALAPRLAATNLALSRCLQMAGRGEEAKLYHDRFEEIEAERARKRGQPAEPARP